MRQEGRKNEVMEGRRKGMKKCRREMTEREGKEE